MSEISRFTLVVCTFLVAACASQLQPQSPTLGQAVTSQQLADIDLIVGPDGDELPPGTGSAGQGEPVYLARCQSCHLADGTGMSAATRLTDGSMLSQPPVKTVGSYWPYATTLFDFIRRAMPADNPKSLSNDEVYQVTAYVLYLNGLIDRNTVLNGSTLPAVNMPNRNGFIDLSERR